MISVLCDFAKYEDYPLVNSKFGVYICTYVDGERILKDMPDLKALKPFALRYDPGWGFGNDGELNSPRELNAPQIEKGEDGKIQPHFQDYDRVVTALQDSAVRMMHVNAYNPVFLQKKDARPEGNMELGMRSCWNTMPEDMAAWREINRLYALHFKALEKKDRFYEIWNEPDLQPVFFTGTMEDFFEIYRFGAMGVREGDADARIGGPVISNAAFDNPADADPGGWAEAFLDFADREKLPLDFFSYHNYASPKKIVPLMRDAIRNRPGMEQVETVISEYNSYKPGTEEFSVGGKIERHHLAGRLLEDFKFFVEQPDISCVYWAQFNDPEVFGEKVDRCGLLELHGGKKAGYYAYQIYSGMPADRVFFHASDEAVDGMASTDGRKFCVVLWNKEKTAQSIKMQFRHLPAAAGKGKVCKIDAWRNSPVDNRRESAMKPDREFTFSGGTVELEEEMPGESVCYFELQDMEQKPKRQLNAVRINRYYFDRFKSNYAEYDGEEAAVYLGMGRETKAVSKIELAFEEDLIGAEVSLRDLADCSAGETGIEIEKEYPGGAVESQSILLEITESDKGEYIFSMPIGAVRTKVTCHMENLNPGAKAKIRLLVSASR